MVESWFRSMYAWLWEIPSAFAYRYRISLRWEILSISGVQILERRCFSILLVFAGHFESDSLSGSVAVPWLTLFS